jgi:hypothetical protein
MYSTHLRLQESLCFHYINPERPAEAIQCLTRPPGFLYCGLPLTDLAK